MPALDSSTYRSLTLPNGLCVSLCSAPRLKRCAAALRVAAGSHDVPEQWPGLAHFLEHLFFLGTERFPKDQNLMTYVQRHGGQVNASTRERTTDFFFELAPSVFVGGLERLCEMLAHPRMSRADQLREREVLHAEFIAWSRDEASRDQLKRLQPLSPRHPLRWFHAGNRFSLPVPRPAFQQALQDFYRRFYQAGQMTLSLTGPQSLNELQAWATRFGGYFTKGRRIDQQKPPALVGGPAEARVEAIDQRQTHLMFACEGLPPEHEQAAVFLCTWMNDPQPGGLVAELRDRGVIQSLKAEVLYEFEGQLLLDVEFVLADACAGTRAPTDECAAPLGMSALSIASSATTHVSNLLFDWLRFFKIHYRQLLDEYTRLERRRLAVSSALTVARRLSAVISGEPGLSDQAIRALDALLEDLSPQTLLQPMREISDQRTGIDWRLPQPNPFLRPAPASSTPASSPPSFTVSDALPTHGEASVYLRWALSTPQPTLAFMLHDGLKTLTTDALQAGVVLSFTTYGNYWQLKLSGLAEPIPSVLKQALRLIRQPDEQVLSRYGQPSHEPAPIPIRQLLKTLPDHYLNGTIGAETNDVGAAWGNARWIGFASGVAHLIELPLYDALGNVPGVPEDLPASAYAPTADPRWAIEPSDSSENAVLMFYPTPTRSLEDEATWRLFAHVVQAPFYQRLRVELQLGYAVFSGFRQIAGRGGLLFGVQSPGTEVGQLVEHIRSFIQTLPDLLESTDLRASIAALQDQLDPAAMDHSHAGEMLWQAHLAGHSTDYFARLQHSLAHLHHGPLNEVARQLALPESPVFGLSNRDGSAL